MLFGERSARPVVLLVALALVVLLVAPLIVNVHAVTPIVFDSKSTATPCTTGPCAATLSWSHVVGSGANGILIVSVLVAIQNLPLKTVSSIKYGTSALAFIGSHLAPSQHAELEMWSVLNPPAGSALVTVTLAGSDDALFAGSVSYFNVGGTHAFGAADEGSGLSPSLTVNANSGDLVVDAVAMAVGADFMTFTNSPGSLQTQRWSSSATIASSGAELFMGGSDQPASSSVMMTWTSTLTLTGGWEQVAVALTPLVIPEYPLGLPLLAVFMIVGYGLIRRSRKA